MWFYSLWSSIFHRFFMKKRYKNVCIFSRQHVFFSIWQTLKFVDRRDGLSTFYIFHVFEIEPAEPEPPPAHSLGRVGDDFEGSVAWKNKRKHRKMHRKKTSESLWKLVPKRPKIVKKIRTAKKCPRHRLGELTFDTESDFGSIFDQIQTDIQTTVFWFLATQKQWKK